MQHGIGPCQQDNCAHLAVGNSRSVFSSVPFAQGWERDSFNRAGAVILMPFLAKMCWSFLCFHPGYDTRLALTKCSPLSLILEIVFWRWVFLRKERRYFFFSSFCCNDGIEISTFLLSAAFLLSFFLWLVGVFRLTGEFWFRGERTNKKVADCDSRPSCASVSQWRTERKGQLFHSKGYSACLSETHSLSQPFLIKLSAGHLNSQLMYHAGQCSSCRS